MKRRIIATIATASMLIAGLFAPPALAADPIGAQLVPDAAYRSCLVRYTNKYQTNPAGNTLTLTDLDDITGDVYCTNSRIIDITGSKYLVNVSSLNLSNNTISSLEPGVFDGLGNLSSLNAYSGG